MPDGISVDNTDDLSIWPNVLQSLQSLKESDIYFVKFLFARSGLRVTASSTRFVDAKLGPLSITDVKVYYSPRQLVLASQTGMRKIARDDLERAIVCQAKCGRSLIPLQCIPILVIIQLPGIAAQKLFLLTAYSYTRTHEQQNGG